MTDEGHHTMTMREQMARAIAECEYGRIDYSPPWWGDDEDQPPNTIRLTDREKERYLAFADAALDLIRDPSDEMVERCAEAIEDELTAEDGWMVNTQALTNMCRDHARACLAGCGRW